MVNQVGGHLVREPTRSFPGFLGLGKEITIASPFLLKSVWLTPQVLFSRTVLFLTVVFNNLLCMYNCQVTGPKSAQVTFHTDENWLFFCVSSRKRTRAFWMHIPTTPTAPIMYALQFMPLVLLESQIWRDYKVRNVFRKHHIPPSCHNFKKGDKIWSEFTQKFNSRGLLRN